MARCGEVANRVLRFDSAAENILHCEMNCIVGFSGLAEAVAPGDSLHTQVGSGVSGVCYDEDRSLS